MSKSNFQQINFNKIGGDNGFLISLEASKNIPFEIKRVYYIFENYKNLRRGFHAHINLKQVAIVLKGSCKFHLDDGVRQEQVELNSPSTGLLIEGLVWREMFDFSNDCVLVVLASELYDENDYIRDFHKFIDIVTTSRNI